ncbi:hypothetical protein CBS101457_005949 [Exobasidium rhododendri]|nr:hypothetical protein CBS101457_005949 [Exobasidium rhododendri]
MTDQVSTPPENEATQPESRSAEITADEVAGHEQQTTHIEPDSEPVENLSGGAGDVKAEGEFLDRKDETIQAEAIVPVRDEAATDPDRASLLSGEVSSKGGDTHAEEKNTSQIVATEEQEKGKEAEEAENVTRITKESDAGLGEQAVESDEMSNVTERTAAIGITDRDSAAMPTFPERVQPLSSLEDKSTEGEGKGAKEGTASEINLQVSDHSNVAEETSTSTDSSLRDHGNVLTIPVSPNPSTSSTKSPKSGGLRIGKGPPPTTQASEEKPFDFNRFLDQMRHKSAGPVGDYVRSFIKGFTKKPYRVSDQTKLIFDFLDFISQKMRECEVWSKLNTTEFENATEAMEKLLMNRLYNHTFSPAVKREGKWNVQTDDLERDRVLKQRIRLFSWISEENLDVPTGNQSKGFIDFAIEELLKINHYKAPRDKVICILNCCKVIFGLIRHLSSEENADTFIPILIFVVLRSNPDHLISNVEYISRFRNPEKLSSESGYYLSSLMGAIAFIETMDYTSLSNITQQEFEAKVEAVVEQMSAQVESTHSSPAGFQIARMDNAVDEKATPYADGQSSAPMTPQASSSSGEEGARLLPLSAGAATLAEDTKAFFQRTGEAARAGIGASLGKPIGALGRLFQESLEGPRTAGSSPSPAGTSGRNTPESPNSGLNNSAAPSSARSRMWNLFGADEGPVQRPQQQSAQQQQQLQQQQYHLQQLQEQQYRSYQQQQHPQQLKDGRNNPSSSLNFGSWSRNMQEEDVSDPQTPASEELRSGRFVTLGEGGEGSEQVRGGNQRSLESQFNAPPVIQRQRRMISVPDRSGSMDPYSMQDDDGGMASGVRTPDDDGSDVDLSSSPTNATSGGRARFSDLGGFLPSFLSEQSMANPRSTQQQHHHHQSQQQQQDQNVEEANSLNDEEAAAASAQIEQAHVTAGVETLKSIFPSIDSSVCRLVLEDCHGDVQASIDKLLEMS